jgi:hypothetical protein
VFGTNALINNTVGGGNSAFGARVLRYNTTGGANSAFGFEALKSNTEGQHNSAFGVSALTNNTTGIRNVAVGSFGLRFNTTGLHNTGVGYSAMMANSTGQVITAVGAFTLDANTTGVRNSAFGSEALGANTTGNDNVAVGWLAGGNQTIGSNNIYLANQGVAAESGNIKIGTAGTHTRTTIAGIRGVTTGVANAIPVLIDGTGQLGTVSSSRRVKNDIRDMGDATTRLLDLRPVMFRYKQEQSIPSGGEVPPEYGLIAEEVAEVFPDLVVYDEKGQPFTVKYHEMAPMLLNEMKKQQHTIEAQRNEIQAQKREHELEIAALTARLARVETRVIGAPSEAQRR